MACVVGYSTYLGHSRHREKSSRDTGACQPSETADLYTTVFQSLKYTCSSYKYLPACLLLYYVPCTYYSSTVIGGIIQIAQEAILPTLGIERREKSSRRYSLCQRKKMTVFVSSGPTPYCVLLCTIVRCSQSLKYACHGLSAYCTCLCF